MSKLNIYSKTCINNYKSSPYFPFELETSFVTLPPIENIRNKQSNKLISWAITIIGKVTYANNTCMLIQPKAPTIMGRVEIEVIVLVVVCTFKIDRRVSSTV